MKTSQHIRLFVLFAITGMLMSCTAGKFALRYFSHSSDYKHFPSTAIHNEGSAQPFADGKQNRQPEKIFKYLDDLMKTEKSITAFLIIKNDTIRYEYYKQGYNDTSVYTSFSLAKSFVSALVGIAVSEKYIQSVHQPITDFLPELKRKDFEKITIEHLLNMKSGIRYKESYSNPFGMIAKEYTGTDLKKNILRLKIEKAPGGQFKYQSINTQLLGIILERATGKSLSNYLSEKIWTPMEMEFSATWSIDSEKHKTEKSFCCLNARTRDFAKLGTLFLHKGNWRGKQIVPEDWVERSTLVRSAGELGYAYQWYHVDQYTLIDSSGKPSNHTKFNPYHNRYSFDNQWKLIKGSLIQDSLVRYYNFDNKKGKVKRLPKGNYIYKVAPTNAFYAHGFLGQFIFVDPANKTVIVRLGTDGGNWWNINGMMYLSDQIK